MSYRVPRRNRRQILLICLSNLDLEKFSMTKENEELGSFEVDQRFPAQSRLTEKMIYIYSHW